MRSESTQGNEIARKLVGDQVASNLQKKSSKEFENEITSYKVQAEKIDDLRKNYQE
jgi:hypothetical protein